MQETQSENAKPHRGAVNTGQLFTSPHDMANAKLEHAGTPMTYRLAARLPDWRPEFGLLSPNWASFGRRWPNFSEAYVGQTVAFPGQTWTNNGSSRFKLGKLPELCVAVGQLLAKPGARRDRRGEWGEAAAPETLRRRSAREPSSRYHSAFAWLEPRRRRLRLRRALSGGPPGCHTTRPTPRSARVPRAALSSRMRKGAAGDTGTTTSKAARSNEFSWRSNASRDGRARARARARGKDR